MKTVVLALLILCSVGLFIGVCIVSPQVFADFVGFICIAVLLRAVWLIGEEQ